MDECKPLPPSTHSSWDMHTLNQGLTLVHFSAQLKPLLWDRGSMQGLFRGCLAGVRGHVGCLGCAFVSEMAQVELRSGRVQAPALNPLAGPHILVSAHAAL